MPHSAALQSLLENIGKAFIGKQEAVRLVAVALLAEGHILIEDVPGVGKTLLARALAKSIDAQFNRIQFTPDLLPSDVIGSNIFNRQTNEFSFHRGPIFANIVLADEINRTTPRTQSALLEAMNDRQVSVDGETYPLAPPFMVLATQNPFEFEGTYLLPESQLDRFLLRVNLGYPTPQDELAILCNHRGPALIDALSPALGGDEVQELQAQTLRVRVADEVADYVLKLVNQTRHHRGLRVGVSTRGAIALQRAAQGRAMVEGRDFVVPDDIKALAVAVLAHRVLSRDFLSNRESTGNIEVIQEILDTTPVPD